MFRRNELVFSVDPFISSLNSAVILAVILKLVLSFSGYVSLTVGFVVSTVVSDAVIKLFSSLLLELPASSVLKTRYLYVVEGFKTVRVISCDVTFEELELSYSLVESIPYSTLDVESS